MSFVRRLAAAWLLALALLIAGSDADAAITVIQTAHTSLTASNSSSYSGTVTFTNPVNGGDQLFCGINIRDATGSPYTAFTITLTGTAGYGWGVPVVSNPWWDTINSREVATYMYAVPTNGYGTTVIVSVTNGVSGKGGMVGCIETAGASIVPTTTATGQHGATGSCTATTSTTGSVAFTGSPLLFAVAQFNSANTNIATSETGYAAAIVDNTSNSDFGVGYAVSGVTSPTSFTFTESGGLCGTWNDIGAVFPASAAVLGTVWDVNNKSSHLVVGPGNQTKVFTYNQASGWASVRGTTSHTTGKYYLEMVVLSNYNNGYMAGFANSGSNLASYPGSDTHSYGFQIFGSSSSCGYYTNGSCIGVGSLNTSTPDWQGIVVELAIDIGNGLVWMRTDRNSNWNGSGTANPATGAGGFSASWSGTAVFPAWGGQGAPGGPVAAAALNAGCFTFAGTIPSGFSAWDTTCPTNGIGIVGTHGPSTFDPNNKNASVTLSGSNLIATSASASVFTPVFSTSGYDSGKRYYEVKQSYNSNTSNQSWYNGIENTNMGTANGAVPCLVGGSYGVGYNAGGNNGGTCYWDNNTPSSGDSWQPKGPLGNNHVIGVAVDFDKGLHWTKDITAGGNWNGTASADPVAGLHGDPILFPGDLFEEWSGENSPSTSGATINFGASAFSGVIPTGYLPWDAPTAFNQMFEVMPQ